MEGVFRRTFKRIAVFVEEGAEEVQRGQFAEGIHVGGAETGDDIEVTVVGFDEGEQAGTVNAFTAGEDFFKIVKIIDDEVEGLETTITGGVLEIDVTDIIFADEIDDICLGEVFGILADFIGKTADTVVSVFHILLFLIF